MVDPFPFKSTNPTCCKVYHVENILVWLLFPVWAFLHMSLLEMFLFCFSPGWEKKELMVKNF